MCTHIVHDEHVDGRRTAQFQSKMVVSNGQIAEYSLLHPSSYSY